MKGNAKPNQPPMDRDLEQLDLALESIVEAVTIVTPNNRIRYCNAACQRIFGYSRAELVGKPLAVLIPRAETLINDELIRASPGEKWEGEVIGVRKGGEQFFAHLTLTLTEGEDREVMGRVVVHRDITQRKWAEDEVQRTYEALRKSEAKNQALLSAIPDLTFRLSRSGTLLDYVDAEQSMALPSGEWLGRKISEVMPLEFAQRVIQFVEQALETGDTQIFECQLPIPWPDGDLHDWETRIVVSDDDEVLGIVRDITGRKRLKERLMQGQRMEALGWLAGGMAHDFNNLLTPIISYADLATGSLPPESPLRGFMQEIQKAAERATHLTRQLLAFSRRQVSEPKIVNLDSFVERPVRDGPWSARVSGREAPRAVGC